VNPPKAKLLLVDDEPKNLMALAALLEEPDRELTLADSGAKALRYLLEDDFALILLDVHMPVMDGFETAELIRERDRTRNVPIIFLTADVRGEVSISKGYALGGVDYIMKPVDSDVLRAKVSTFVELFKKSKELERQAEELAESTALLRSILDGSTEHAILALDAGGLITEWNAGAEKIYGHSRDSVAGRRTIDVLFEQAEAGDVVRALFEDVKRRGTAEGEFTHRRVDGGSFTAQVSLTQRTTAGGANLGYAWISRDVTTIKQAEQMREDLRRESSARLEAEFERQELQQIIDVLPEALVIVDAAGNLKLQNQAAQYLLGPMNEQENVARHNASVLRRPDGTLVPIDAQPLHRVLMTGEPVLGERLMVRLEDETQKSMLTSAVALREGDGSITGAAVAFQDISALDDLNQQKEEFLAALAHDLKTPLTVILGRARILERRANRLPTQEAQFFAELLGSIGRSTWRATSLVNSLLDSARMEMGSSLELNREQVNLSLIIEDLEKDFRALTDRHELRVELDGAAIGLWDRERIMRVLSNLLENAVKYSPDGGEIVVRTRVAADDAEGVEIVGIQITDHGIGIPARDQTKIFDPFFRARNATLSFAGTGIGLFASKKIIEAHGGQITVSSEINAGSTFSIRLPLDLPGQPNSQDRRNTVHE
jgi:PAS domain S-box-containing protein